MSPVTYLCLVLAVGLLGDSVSATCTAAEEQAAKTEIEAQSLKYRNYVVAGNKDGVVSLYTDDAIIMPPKYGVAGPSTLRQHLNWVASVGSITVDSEHMEVVKNCQGDMLVIERSESHVYNKQGAIMYEGKDLTIWKKDGDTFKMYIVMYNQGN